MKKITVFMFMLLLVAAPLAANAAQKGPDDWNFSLGTFFWAADADVTLESPLVSVSGTAKFADIIKNAEPSINVMFAAQKDKFSFHADVFNIWLKDDISARTGGERTTRLSVIIPEAYVAYDIVDTNVGDNMKFKLAPLVGARFFYSRFEIDKVGGGEAVDRHKSWTDGIVGAIATYDIGEKLSIKLRGDAGGFDIGESNKEAWFGLAALDWRYAKNRTLSLGYADLYFKREGSGLTGERTTEVEFKGPIMSHTFQF